MEEIWVDIPEYKGLYKVSNLGKIKSITRIVKGANNSNRIVQGKLLKNSLVKHDDYYSVVLWKYNKRKLYTVHSLVLKSFSPKKDNLLVINHINGIKIDNRLENLEWCTRAYNQYHAINIIKTKKFESITGIKHYRAKKVYQYDLYGDLIDTYNTLLIAAKHNNFSHQNISACCRNEKNIKTYKQYIWSYTPLTKEYFENNIINNLKNNKLNLH
jgi:hypothetical protein